MSRALYINSPLPPSVNHYLMHRAIYQNGKPRAMVYETKEAKVYKKNFRLIVENAVKEQKWETPVNSTQHFFVDAYYFFDRVDRDASNYEKCMIDAITETGLIWKDDNVVLYRPQRILYNKNDPHIELIIHPVDYIGIFDNKEEKEKFETKCKGCTRYKRNCSELKSAILGKVTGNVDIDGCVCSKFRPADDKK